MFLNPIFCTSIIFCLTYLTDVEANFPFDRPYHLRERSRNAYFGHQDRIENDNFKPAFRSQHSHNRPRPYSNDDEAQLHYNDMFGSKELNQVENKGNSPSWIDSLHHDKVKNPQEKSNRDIPSNIYHNSPLQDKDGSLKESGENAKYHKQRIDRDKVSENVHLYPFIRQLERNDAKLLSGESSRLDQSHALETEVSTSHFPKMADKIHDIHKLSMEQTRGLSEQSKEYQISREMEKEVRGKLLQASSILPHFDKSEDRSVWKAKRSENDDWKLVPPTPSFTKASSFLNAVPEIPSVKSDEMLIEDSSHLSHELIMEHFHGKHNNIIDSNFKPSKHLAAASDSIKQAEEENPIQFASSAFKPMRQNEDKFDETFQETLLHTAKQHNEIDDKTTNNDNDQHKANRETQRTWMNFRVFVDEDGKLKLEMSPSTKSSNESPISEIEPVTLGDKDKTIVQNINRKQPHSVEGASQEINLNTYTQTRPTGNFASGYQNSYNPRLRRIEAFDHLGLDRLMVDDMHYGPPAPHPYQPRQPFRDMHKPIHHPGPMPHNTLFLHEMNSGYMDQPKLLSERFPRTQPRSDSKSTTFMDAISIPLNIDVDNPLTSGCDKLQCTASCPGDLHKLSPTTGCPTCDCCPIVQCNLRCAFGYDADSSGCPVCKCLTE